MGSYSLKRKDGSMKIHELIEEYEKSKENLRAIIRYSPGIRQSDRADIELSGIDHFIEQLKDINVQHPLTSRVGRRNASGRQDELNRKDDMKLSQDKVILLLRALGYFSPVDFKRAKGTRVMFLKKANGKHRRADVTTDGNVNGIEFVSYLDEILA